MIIHIFSFSKGAQGKKPAKSGGIGRSPGGKL